MLTRSSSPHQLAQVRQTALHSSFSDIVAATSEPVMSQRNLFLGLPEELYAEAREIARKRHISISDLLIEALSESIEAQHRLGWIAENAMPALQNPSRVH